MFHPRRGCMRQRSRMGQQEKCAIIDVDNALGKYVEEMKSMEWVKKNIDVDANNVHVASEETPVNTSDKFTPQYLNDDDVKSFCKLPQCQVKTRYEIKMKAQMKLLQKNLKH